MREALIKVAITGGAVVSVVALAVAPASAGQKPGHTNQGNHGTPSAACTAARAIVAADRATVRADRKQLNTDRATLEADQASSSPNVPADQAAVAADQAKLKADRATLKTDLHARNKACSNGKHKH